MQCNLNAKISRNAKISKSFTPYFHHPSLHVTSDDDDVQSLSSTKPQNFGGEIGDHDGHDDNDDNDDNDHYDNDDSAHYDNDVHDDDDDNPLSDSPSPLAAPCKPLASKPGQARTIHIIVIINITIITIITLIIIIAIIVINAGKR